MIRMIDETSKKILTILQNEGRISFRQLAKQVNLSPSAVVERIHKLEDKGIIKGYKAEIDYEKMGFHLHAFIRMNRKTNEIGVPKKITSMFEVRNFWIVAGDHDFLLEVIATNKEHLEDIIEKLFQYGTTATAVILSKTTKESLLPNDAIFEYQKKSSDSL